jgi:hypothetical protein
MGIQEVDTLNNRRHHKRAEIKIFLTNLINIKKYIHFNIEDLKIELVGLIDKLNKDTISISIVSEVSSGKSTFLNALVFNQAVLESKIGETTAKVFNIKYDYAYSIDGVQKENLESLTQQVAKENRLNLTAIKEKEKLSKIQSVITLPNENLKKGIELYDTPGFATIHEKPMLTLIKEAISKSDATILLLDISQGIKNSEKLFIKNMLHRIQLNKRFIVLNKYDTIINEDDLELKTKEEIEDEINALVKNIEATLQELQKDTKQPIETYHISAKKALVGKIKNDEKRVQESRFDLFEDAFWSKMVLAKDEIFEEHLQLFDTLKQELKNQLEEEKHKLLQKSNALQVEVENARIKASEALGMSDKIEELKILNRTIVSKREKKLQKRKKELVDDITSILAINLDFELKEISIIDKLMFWRLKRKYQQTIVSVLDNSRSYIKHHLQAFIEEFTHKNIHKKQDFLILTFNNNLNLQFSLQGYKQKHNLDVIIDQAIEKIENYLDWKATTFITVLRYNFIKNEEQQLKHSYFELTAQIDSISSHISHFLKQSNSELQQYSLLSNKAIDTMQEALKKESNEAKEIKEINHSLKKINNFILTYLSK